MEAQGPENQDFLVEKMSDATDITEIIKRKVGQIRMDRGGRDMIA